MKQIAFILLLLAHLVGWAQEKAASEIAIEQLVSQVNSTSGSSKLVLLDSLTQQVMHRPELNYEQHAKATVELALALDSISLATFHASQYVFYLANRAGKPKEGIAYFDSFVEGQREIPNNSHKAQLYLNGGDSYFFGGETAGSIPLYQMAGTLALEAGDSLLLGKSKTYMSDAYADTGKFAEAGSVLSEAELIFESMKDTFNLLTTRNSRANLYSRIGFYDEAEEVRTEIVRLAEQRNDYRMLQSTLYNSAIDARIIDDVSRSISALNRALHFVKLGELDGYEPKIQISLLRSYVLIDSLDQAKDILADIAQNSERYQQGLDAFNYSTALSLYEYKLGNYTKARDIAERLFSSGSVKDFGNAETVHELLSKIYDSIGNSDLAFFHYQKYAEIRDSITGIKNVRALTYYQTLYETKRRDATIAEQKSEIAVLDFQNKIKKQWLIFGGLGVLVALIIFYLVWSRKNAKRRKTLIEGFSQELINAQEQERLRLARELHDSVGQKLMLLSKKTRQLEDENTDQLAESTLTELRSISRGLHPANLQKLGITKALKQLVNEVDDNTDILFSHDIDQLDDKLSAEDALHLYRIIQECLQNLVKHSNARSATVKAKEQEGLLHVSVHDTGAGFVFGEALHKKDSLGMRTLMERAKMIRSKLEVISAPSKGTTIQLKIQLDQGI